jgi:P27 family predicted phage terminase small subunit
VLFITFKREFAMAPRTKPTALKLLHGDDRQHPERINKAEPKPAELADLIPPVELDQLAREVWDYYAPRLQRTRVLTDVDVHTLAALCVAWSNYVQAVQVVRAEGPLIDGYRGSKVRNPAALVAKDSLGEFLRLATEFGLTPSSRARLTVPEGGEVDPLAALFS